MGGAVSAGRDNDELVDNLKNANYIKTPRVETVFRIVDRGHYYTEDKRGEAYKDLAWRLEKLHMSAPCIYSEVMESLELEPGLSFLNIGSGTGYLSTMVGLILGPGGLNHGIELHEEVVQYARQKLEDFKARSPHFDELALCEPSFVSGNCLLISPDSRQYDRVYVGAACPAEHAEFMKQMLKPDGILVMPLNDQLMKIRRTGDTDFSEESVLPVSFASLVIPADMGKADPIFLPEPNPLPLKDLCRYAIRALLRSRLMADHTDYTRPRPLPRRPPRDTMRDTMMLSRAIYSDSDDDREEEERGVGPDNAYQMLLSTFSPARRWRHRRPVPMENGLAASGSRDDDDDEEEEQEVETSSSESDSAYEDDHVGVKAEGGGALSDSDIQVEGMETDERKEDQEGGGRTEDGRREEEGKDEEMKEETDREELSLAGKTGKKAEDVKESDEGEGSEVEEGEAGTGDESMREPEGKQEEDSSELEELEVDKWDGSKLQQEDGEKRTEDSEGGSEEAKEVDQEMAAWERVDNNEAEEVEGAGEKREQPDLAVPAALSAADLADPASVSSSPSSSGTSGLGTTPEDASRVFGPRSGIPRHFVLGPRSARMRTCELVGQEEEEEEEIEEEEPNIYFGDLLWERVQQLQIPESLKSFLMFNRM